jgi:pyruvate dehydrogenase E2 component (dihydrolipoamide acetyltransferase)
MAIVIRMPEVLAGATEGVISHWSVKEGDEVAVGDVLAEIETDKASVEYQAEDAGTVARLLQSAGQMVQVGEPIAVFAAAGDTDADIEKALADAGAFTEEAAPEAPVAAAEPVAVAEAVPAQPVVAGAEVVAAAPVAARGAGERVFASPIVRKLAREAGIDLAHIPGSGPGGRIVRKDFDAYRASAPATAPVAAASAPAPARSSAGFTEIPHSSMRRAIARRLTESKSTVPHFYVKADCVVNRLLEARAQLNEGLGVKTSVNDWVVKAVGHALMAVPGSNVIWTDTAMRKFDHADISVAVATEGGLYTPVVRGVDQLSIPQISTEIRALAEKARGGTIKQDEIEGGSFAVTNLGMFGTEEFSAILNPPQSGILAVGAAREKVIAVDGELQIAQVMTVTLSADHRAVDGALAAEWMAAFKKAIENPVSLLIS